MAEAEWLTCEYPSDMLLWLARLEVSQRKVVLLLVAIHSDGSYEYSVESKRITAGLGHFVEGVISRAELDSIYLDEGVTNGAPLLFSVENARYSIATTKSARKAACRLIREIFGNPFRPVAFSPEWRTDTAVMLAQQMYDSRDFSAMPILADALQDAGCDNQDILQHCRGDGPHVRGCWVVDLVLGKE
jgi:hypothetical protein